MSSAKIENIIAPPPPDCGNLQVEHSLYVIETQGSYLSWGVSHPKPYKIKEKLTNGEGGVIDPEFPLVARMYYL